VWGEGLLHDRVGFVREPQTLLVEGDGVGTVVLRDFPEVQVAELGRRRGEVVPVEATQALRRLRADVFGGEQAVAGAPGVGSQPEVVGVLRDVLFDQAFVALEPAGREDDARGVDAESVTVLGGRDHALDAALVDANALHRRAQQRRPAAVSEKFDHPVGQFGWLELPAAARELELRRFQRDALLLQPLVALVDRFDDQPLQRLVAVRNVLANLLEGVVRPDGPAGEIHRPAEARSLLEEQHVGTGLLGPDGRY
jgi:hypothetical protein